VLRSILSSMGVWEIYSIYYLHMEGMCTTGLQFQTFAVFGSIEACAFIYQPMCGGQWAQVCVIHLRPHPRFSPSCFKMEDLLAYLHHNHSPENHNHSPENVVFSLILLSRDPLPAFSQLIQDGGFSCCLHHNHSPENVVFSLALLLRDPLPGFLPADPRWRICVLTCIIITTPKMSSFP
jgi:hypothetical protein